MTSHHHVLNGVILPILERNDLMIIESLRLEETSKIMKSNHQPNTTLPTKPCPEVPYLHVF